MAKVEVSGIENIQDELNAYIDMLRDMKTIYKKIEDELNVIIEESIDTQISATTSKAYQQLSNATQKLEGKPAKPALVSRQLGGLPTVKMTLEGSNDSAILSTNLPYAEVHQFGNPNNKLFGKHKAPIPARPFLPIKKDKTFTQAFQNRLDEIIQEYIDTKINER